MSLVRIENRGKNLINILDYFTNVSKFYPNPPIYVTNDEIYFDKIPPYQGVGFLVKVIPNKTYTLSFQLVNKSNVYVIIKNAISQKQELSTIKSNTASTSPITFTPTSNFITIAFLNYNASQPFSIKNIQLEEGSEATEYEPPRNDYIEFDGELFGYAGVFDELHDDGTLIKRWQRESITITSGAGTVSKTGTGTCILINETDGLPYEGTVSGTSISTSAPDGTYTVIYQLATPEISQINFSGSGLILDKGNNNIILPANACLSVEYEGTGIVQESLIYMQDLTISEDANYREYQPVNSKYTKSIQTAKKYTISFKQAYLERDLTDKLDKDTRFTLEITKENEDGRTEIDRYVNCRIDNVSETDNNNLRMEDVNITAEAKEVVQ